MRPDSSIINGYWDIPPPAIDGGGMDYGEWYLFEEPKY
jgi:hypothetical protein